AELARSPCQFGKPPRSCISRKVDLVGGHVGPKSNGNALAEGEDSPATQLTQAGEDDDDDEYIGCPSHRRGARLLGPPRLRGDLRAVARSNVRPRSRSLRVLGARPAPGPPRLPRDPAPRRRRAYLLDAGRVRRAGAAPRPAHAL